MPEISRALAERFRKIRRDEGASGTTLLLSRRVVLAEQRIGEQFFAVAGMRRGWRELERMIRSTGAANAV